MSTRGGLLRWVAVPLLVVPVTWLLFTGLGRDPRDIPSPLVGKPLPAFAATTLEGEEFSSESLDGRPALVNVWASWCDPCVDEHPLLLAAARAYAGELSLVGIVYQDSPDGARGFLARYGDGGWPDVLDPSGRIAIDLGVTGPPETFFVDAAGIVRYRHVGPLTEEVLVEQLAVLGLDR
ncbi:MAG TPA: DsbE family thiol:disulfide interchange protein [Candidatus Limnocylindria bacterium]